jgi:hypothetical protein
MAVQELHEVARPREDLADVRNPDDSHDPAQGDFKFDPPRGVRTELICSYEIPRMMYKVMPHRSAAKKLETLGMLIWYGNLRCSMSRKRRTPMDVDALVKRWHEVVVGLAIAHDKDAADRYEAAIEECLTPILAAPIKQVREFYPKLLEALKQDQRVPFLVWRSYEVWVNQVIAKAPDEDIKQLKTDLAREITEMVEREVKDQLPQAMIRALQWRSPSQLEEVKKVVAREQAAGRGVRLKGRESCLFLEAGGEEGEPEVCVQI